MEGVEGAGREGGGGGGWELQGWRLGGREGGWEGGKVGVGGGRKFDSIDAIIDPFRYRCLPLADQANDEARMCTEGVSVAERRDMSPTQKPYCF